VEGGKRKEERGLLIREKREGGLLLRGTETEKREERERTRGRGKERPKKVKMSRINNQWRI